MSYAPQVKTGPATEWAGNALRFATREEAEGNVANLMARWWSVADTRVVESDDPVNYRWTDEGLAAVDSDQPPTMPANRVKL